MPNLPTALTWARIAAVPLIVAVFYLDLPTQTQNLLATLIFVASAATDWLDGYLARKLNQTSAFGAFLDPVADKMLVSACVLVLVHLGRLHVLLALVIIGREIAISSLREWMAQIGASSSVAVHMVGKLKTAAQMAAIGFLLYHAPFAGLPIAQIGTWLIWVAAALTLWSMAYYIAKAWPAISAKTGKQ